MWQGSGLLSATSSVPLSAVPLVTTLKRTDRLINQHQPGVRDWSTLPVLPPSFHLEQDVVMGGVCSQHSTLLFYWPLSFPVCPQSQPPLFPALEREVSIPSALALVHKCHRSWTQARQLLLKNSMQYKKAADRCRRPAPEYRVGQKVWLSTANLEQLGIP